MAIELKAGKFKPEYAGKMNFYLNLLNDFVREPDENPSIDIILHKTGRPGETNHAGTGNRRGMNLMPNVGVDWFVSDLELQIEVVPVCNRRGNNFPFKGHRAIGIKFDLFLTVITSLNQMLRLTGDSVDMAAEAGVTAIVQPGGSIRDEEVIETADKHGIAMIFTGRGHFRH